MLPFLFFSHSVRAHKLGAVRVCFYSLLGSGWYANYMYSTFTVTKNDQLWLRDVVERKNGILLGGVGTLDASHVIT